MKDAEVVGAETGSPIAVVSVNATPPHSPGFGNSMLSYADPPGEKGSLARKDPQQADMKRQGRKIHFRGIAGRRPGA